MLMLCPRSYLPRCSYTLLTLGAIALAGCTAEPDPANGASSAAQSLSSSSATVSSNVAMSSSVFSGLSASLSTSSSLASSTSETISSSSVSSAVSSAPIVQSNHYDAPKVAQPPVIDGIEDSSWSAARWQKIDVRWLGAQPQYPSPEDYSGRYKVMWDANYLYLLVDIIDDVIFDAHRDPLSSELHIDDTVELFIDEDNSGGNHWNNNAANAWAYHVSTYKDVVDFGLSGEPVLLNDHIQTEINTQGTRHLWELRVSIYDDQYNFAQGASNTPVTLFAGKTLGLSVCYIDNDNNRFERESMMGSVDTQGHKDDLGYMNADVFGTLTLLE